MVKAETETRESSKGWLGARTVKALAGTSIRSHMRSLVAMSYKEGFGSKSSGIHFPMAWAIGRAPVWTKEASSGRQKCPGRFLLWMWSWTGEVVCTWKQRSLHLSPGVTPAGVNSRRCVMRLFETVLLRWGGGSVPSHRQTVVSNPQMLSPMALLRSSFPTLKLNCLAKGGASDSS